MQHAASEQEELTTECQMILARKFSRLLISVWNEHMGPEK